MPRTNRCGRSGRNTACEGSLHPSGARRSCGYSRLPRAPLAIGGGERSIPHQVLHRAFTDASFHRHAHGRSNHPAFGRHALSVSGFLRGVGGRDYHSQHPPFSPQSLINARFNPPVIYGSSKSASTPAVSSTSPPALRRRDAYQDLRPGVPHDGSLWRAGAVCADAIEGVMTLIASSAPASGGPLG
jgi:hypothetical protein